MNYNASQKKAIYANDNKIVCLAAPASGKTRTLTARVERLINEGVDPTKIVAITFTRMAAEEMRNRLGERAETMFIGTVHSYANKVCALNGITNYTPISQGDFDRIITNAIKIPKDQYPEVEHLLIDESQDLTPLEFGFIEKIPYKNIFYVGDDRQNIYQFRGSTDQYIRHMANDPDFTVYYLLENYRNAPNILDFANDLISDIDPLSPNSKPVKQKDGILEKVSFDIALQDLEEAENWSSWFILTRTNNELEVACDILTQKEIPYITFKIGELENNDVLESIIKDNVVKVLTIHSSKGLENSNVIVIGARLYSEEERKIAYVGATRAKNALYWCPGIRKRKKKGQAVKRIQELVEEDPHMISFE